MPHHNHNRGGGGGGGPRPPHRSQSFESNGPSVKIRGNAYQVFERYIAMAREAQASGDRVAAENLYQHAEHYFRIMNAQGDGQQHGQPRPTTPADLEMSGGDGQNEGQPQDEGEAQVQIRQNQPPPAPPSDEQPPYRDDPYEQPRSY
jgi:Domain of unknown function (DUF4167)